MHMYGAVEVQLRAFLTMALDGVFCFTFQPPYWWGKYPGTHWIGDWVGLRTPLDTVVNRNNLQKTLRF
jgi:hypothetical protein